MSYENVRLCNTVKIKKFNEIYTEHSHRWRYNKIIISSNLITLFCHNFHLIFFYQNHLIKNVNALVLSFDIITF